MPKFVPPSGMPRHKKPGPREPSGRLSRSAKDQGTPELIRQRIALHGFSNIGTEFPIDVLAAKGLLAGSNEHAGTNWQRVGLAARLCVLYGRQYGRTYPIIAGQIYEQAAAAPDACVDLDRKQSTLLPHERAILDAETLRQWLAALKRAGRGTYDAVMNVAVYCRPLPRDRVALGHLAAQVRDGLMTIEAVRPVRLRDVEHYLNRGEGA